MKIAIIGATGFVGSKLLSEALARGHEVTAIVRNIDKLPKHSHLMARKADVAQTADLTAALTGHESVISAYNPKLDPQDSGIRSIIEASRQSRVPRLLVVGGAGSLEVAPGQRLIDQPDFPAEWKAGASRTVAVLERLQKESSLDWVFLCPAAKLAPGERTGRYRVGQDQLLTDASGASHISLEDYAVAMLDEVERPQHHRERFAVGY